ncbi:MAG: DUF6887 family protein [Xenococcaceae cyanobacterium]
MSQLNFQAMSQKELHQYVLTHREDLDAFHAYVDKLNAEGNWVEMPPLASEQDLENYLEFIERIRNSSKSGENAV